jgi:hypothetical protein
MGMGIAIRDYRGKLLVAYCATREFITDPATAEALTAWQAAELSHRLGLQNIVLEGDALVVVNVLRTEETWLGRYGHILQDAKHMISQIANAGSGKLITSTVKVMVWPMVWQNRPSIFNRKLYGLIIFLYVFGTL